MSRQFNLRQFMLMVAVVVFVVCGVTAFYTQRAAALIAAITPVSRARGFDRFGISILSFRKLARSGRFIPS